MIIIEFLKKLVEQVVDGIKMNLNIPIKVTIKPDKKFFERYKTAVNRTLSQTTNIIKQEIPSKQVKDDLGYTINFAKGEARIGWSKGSKSEMLGSVLEFGSGERGKEGGSYSSMAKHRGSWSGYKSPFGSQTDYTIPIRPTHSKHMVFMGNNGKMIKMKEFKGHRPRYILTKGLQRAMIEMPKVFANEINKK